MYTENKLLQRMAEFIGLRKISGKLFRNTKHEIASTFDAISFYYYDRLCKNYKILMVSKRQEL